MKKIIQILSVTTILASAGGMAQAQTADTIRIMQLEENVRQLNGQVEELRFQLLQMQEDLRKTQENNEFRFQELEDQSDASGSNKELRLGKLSASEASKEESDANKYQSLDFNNLEIADERQKKTIDGVEIFDPNKDKSADELGIGVGTLGTITFDANGNLIDNNVGGNPIQLLPGANNEASANLPKEPQALFDLGYQYFLSGSYELSAEVFQTYSDRYPDGTRLSKANFWLGESFFLMRRYEDSARVFLSNHKMFPNGSFAPQNLVKLGVSLAALNQRELACATYAEVPKLYPEMKKSVREMVEVEQRSAKCKG